VSGGCFKSGDEELIKETLEMLMNLSATGGTPWRVAEPHEPSQAMGQELIVCATRARCATQERLTSSLAAARCEVYRRY